MGRRRVRWDNVGWLAALLAAGLLIATRDSAAPPVAQAPDVRDVPRLRPSDRILDRKEVTHHRRTQSRPDHPAAAAPPPPPRPTSGEFTPDPAP